MSLEVEDTPLAGLKLIRPRPYDDARGYLLEIYHQQKLSEIGLKDVFVQDNLSASRKNVLRGLHFQYPQWQGKLVSVLEGEVFDVAVDLRDDSPTFGRWYGQVLSASNHLQLYIPAGFGHGFCVTGSSALVLYKCTAFYNPGQDQTLLWSDPTVGIEWPVQNPIISDKDAKGMGLESVRALSRRNPSAPGLPNKA